MKNKNNYSQPRPYLFPFPALVKLGSHMEISRKLLLIIYGDKSGWTFLLVDFLFDKNMIFGSCCITMAKLLLQDFSKQNPQSSKISLAQSSIFYFQVLRKILPKFL